MRIWCAAVSSSLFSGLFSLDPHCFSVTVERERKKEREREREREDILAVKCQEWFFLALLSPRRKRGNNSIQHPHNEVTTAYLTVTFIVTKVVNGVYSTLIIASFPRLASFYKCRETLQEEKERNDKRKRETAKCVQQTYTWPQLKSSCSVSAAFDHLHLTCLFH